MKRLAAAVAVLALGVVFARGDAGAAEKSVEVTPSVEAWYQPNPTCDLPVGCVTPSTAIGLLPVDVPVDIPVVLPTPYPAGTLHVAYSAGQETARAFLTIPKDKLEGTIVSATLDIPLDTSPTSGSAAPEMSHALVCLFSSDITAVEGSLESPPAVGCEGAAELKYVATPQPKLTASLDGLRAGLATTTGLAIIPDASAGAAEAWHVVFSAHTRSGATPPAVLRAVVRPDDETDVSGDEEALDEFVEDFDPGLFDPSVGFGTDEVIGEVATNSGDDFAPTTPAVTTTSGYAYGVVWLLPLLAVFGIPAIARILTKDLRRAS